MNASTFTFIICILFKTLSGQRIQCGTGITGSLSIGQTVQYTFTADGFVLFDTCYSETQTDLILTIKTLSNVTVARCDDCGECVVNSLAPVLHTTTLIPGNNYTIEISRLSIGNGAYRMEMRCGFVPTTRAPTFRPTLIGNPLLCGEGVSGNLLSNGVLRHNFTYNSGINIFDTCYDQTTFDTVLTITNLNGTIVKTCDDCGGCETNILASTLSIANLIEGQMYTIELKGHSASEFGNYRLERRCIPFQTLTPTFSTRNPTKKPTFRDPIGCGQGLTGFIGIAQVFQYNFTYVEGYVLFDTCYAYTEVDTVLTIKSLNGTTLTTCDDCNECRYNIFAAILTYTNLIPGTTYTLEVSGWRNSTGPFQLEMRCGSFPTSNPSTIPTITPTNIPSIQTILPTIMPSVQTNAPTNTPTVIPTNGPTIIPTSMPTNSPTFTNPITCGQGIHGFYSGQPVLYNFTFTNVHSFVVFDTCYPRTDSNFILNVRETNGTLLERCVSCGTCNLNNGAPVLILTTLKASKTYTIEIFSSSLGNYQLEMRCGSLRSNKPTLTPTTRPSIYPTTSPVLGRLDCDDQFTTRRNSSRYWLASGSTNEKKVIIDTCDSISQTIIEISDGLNGIVAKCNNCGQKCDRSVLEWSGTNIGYILTIKRSGLNNDPITVKIRCEASNPTSTASGLAEAVYNNFVWTLIGVSSGAGLLLILLIIICIMCCCMCCKNDSNNEKNMRQNIVRNNSAMSPSPIPNTNTSIQMQTMEQNDDTN